MHLNIFKKKEVPEKNLSMREKKHQANLTKDHGLYFQIGLILSLFIVFGVFQIKVEKKVYADHSVTPIEDPLEEIDITNFVVEKEIVQQKQTQLNKVVLQHVTEFEVKDDIIDIEDIITPDDPVVVNDLPDIDKMKVVDTPDNIDPQPISLVQELPVFPGCEKFSDKEKQMECFSKKIAKHINKKFDVDIAAENGITGKQKVNVSFVISDKGEIVDVRARAPHPALQKEAIKAVNSLPKMKPAKQGFKNVPVRYALPISFRVQD